MRIKEKRDQNKIHVITQLRTRLKLTKYLTNIIRITLCRPVLEEIPGN